VTPVKGCNPTSVTTLATGGSKLVLIVDAYDDPTAASDLTVYSKQFGLPAVTSANFEVVYAAGTKPPVDSTGGWEFEESLDVQMAHALAPNAKVVLVEAASSSTSDLLAAVTVAANMAVAAGGGEVSNSWGEGEFSGEDSYESTFAAANTVFFASTGDSHGTLFPSVLQNVIGAGGTSINRNPSHVFTDQTSWVDGGGGISSQIAIPSYQAAEKKVAKVVGKKRGVPDFSFDANPNTGVVIYDTTPYEGETLDWAVVGGTSVASPALAASINAAGSFAASTVAELTTIYGDYTTKADWTDITSGNCSNKGNIQAKKGYDLCTGIGVPNGYAGK
jgi:subtilase family serine protease